MMIRGVGLLFFFLVISSATSAAQDTALCGSPPPPEVLKELSDKTKGDVEGKAQAISKVLGSADLSGNIEKERRTLYQTTDSSERDRADFYLAYVTCVLLMKDTTMPMAQKLEAVRALHSPIPKGSSKKESLDNFLAQFRNDTTLDSAREALGAPRTRRNLTEKVGAANKSYVMERYAADGVDVILIGSSPFRAIAVSVEAASDGKAGKVSVPVPYYVTEDPNGGIFDPSYGLGGFVLSEVRDNCRGPISVLDQKLFFAVTPACYFGRGGGYNTFVFGFSAEDALEGCGDSVLDLDKKPFQSIKCPKFWKSKPSFVLVFLPAETDPPGENQLNALAVRFAADVMQTLYLPF